MEEPTTAAVESTRGSERQHGDAPHGGHAPRVPGTVRLSNVVVLIALPAAAATLLASAGGIHWSVDLLAHFPLPCLLALLPAALLLLLARRWQWAALFAGSAAICVLRLWPLWFASPLQPGASAAAPDHAPVPLRVVAANVCFDNQRLSDLLPQLLLLDADLVAIAEVTERVRRQLEPLLLYWPLSVVETNEDCYGIALYSRLPLSRTEILYLGTDRAPAIRAVVHTEAGEVGVVCIHPPRPGTEGRSGERDRAFAELAAALSPLPALRLVLGDANATRWSTPFAAAMAQSNLRDSSEGQGYQGSWPAGLPGWLRLPIDHVLVSDGIGVRRRELLPACGSDHLPVFAELLLPPKGN